MGEVRKSFLEGWGDTCMMGSWCCQLYISSCGLWLIVYFVECSLDWNIVATVSSYLDFPKIVNLKKKKNI